MKAIKIPGELIGKLVEKHLREFVLETATYFENEGYSTIEYIHTLPRVFMLYITHMMLNFEESLNESIQELSK